MFSKSTQRSQSVVDGNKRQGSALPTTDNLPQEPTELVLVDVQQVLVGLIEKIPQVDGRAPLCKIDTLVNATMLLATRLLGREIRSIGSLGQMIMNPCTGPSDVRLIGEVISALRGQLLSPTRLDYIEILGLAANNDQKTQTMSEYLAEHTLLHSSLSRYSQSKLASSCT